MIASHPRKRCNKQPALFPHPRLLHRQLLFVAAQTPPDLQGRLGRTHNKHFHEFANVDRDRHLTVARFADLVEPRNQFLTFQGYMQQR